MEKKSNKPRPSYKYVVSTCALSLALGAVLLGYLMETRPKMPPRKYVVNTSGDIIGIAKPVRKADVTDADTIKIKQQVERRVEKAKREEAIRKQEEGERAQDLIVPSVPDEDKGEVKLSQQSASKADMVVPDISVPKVEKVE